MSSTATKEPLPAYRCSDPSCEQIWQHLGAPLTFRPVPDPRAGMDWHPCPSCTDREPTIVAMTHRVRSQACADLAPRSDAPCED